MSLIRVQTVWTGVAGAPYYTNVYCIGPLSTGNGASMHAAWHAFLNSLVSTLTSGLVATVEPELLEFDETNSNVTGAGSAVQSSVNFTGLGDDLPHMSQALVQWHTSGIVHNRRVRGRTFIPGALEAENGPDGTPLAAVGTPLQSAIDTYLSTMSGRARVWSRKFEQLDPGKAESNPSRPGSAHAIESGTVAPYWAVLRSRRD